MSCRQWYFRQTHEEWLEVSQVEGREQSPRWAQLHPQKCGGGTNLKAGVAGIKQVKEK